MKIAILGVGGVGSYYGGRLSATGVDVSFIAREKTVEALRTQGLLIESALGNAHLHELRVTSHPQDIGPVDVVLLCVKAYDLEEVGSLLGPLMDENTGVVCTQNGVDAIDRLTSRLERGCALGAVVYGNTLLVTPGHVRHLGTLARLRVGGRTERAQKIASQLVTACKACSIDAETTTQIDVELWSKFVLFSVMSAACCLSNLPTGSLRDDPAGRAMLERGMRETVAVANASDVHLESDVVERSLMIVDEMAAESIPSMLVDLRSGRRLEIEHLSGTVVRLGHQLDIDVPFHETAYAALKHYADGRTMTAATVIDDLPPGRKA